MVAVLFPSLGVACRRLQVHPRVRTDPHVGPGRRDSERRQPLPLRPIQDQGTVGFVVGETLPCALSRDPGPGVCHVGEAGNLGGRHMLRLMVGFHSLLSRQNLRRSLSCLHLESDLKSHILWETIRFILNNRGFIHLPLLSYQY